MPHSKHRGWKSALLHHETILFLVVAAEWFYFYLAGTNFGSLENTFGIVCHSVEFGLLALAMTPIILTGGIDLSVGSLLGLCAILFGKLWRDAGLPVPAAAACTLVIGALAGGLNVAIINGLRLPPLIVTLGTFSLFRGLAEAITRGADTFTKFPASFLFLGEGTWLGVPVQMFVFALVATAIWLLVHRTTFGRSFRAIGFSPEGARYAGLPVGRRLAPLLHEMKYALPFDFGNRAMVIFFPPEEADEAPELESADGEQPAASATATSRRRAITLFMVNRFAARSGVKGASGGAAWPALSAGATRPAPGSTARR